MKSMRRQNFIAIALVSGLALNYAAYHFGVGTAELLGKKDMIVTWEDYRARYSAAAAF